MTGKLKGKTVLITGASSGIGRMTALCMAAVGANLFLVARRAARLEDVATEARARGAATETLPGDVTDSKVMHSAVAACVARFERLDILVNNAGEGFFASVEDTTEADLDRMIGVNLKGAFHGIQAALPVMRRQGTGHIINMASTAGRRGSPYVGAYCASKFALIGLTESLRVELMDTGIDVSLVCPGVTRTDFFTSAQRRTHYHAGPGAKADSVESVAARIVDLVQRPTPEVLTQPVGRKVFLALNLLAPGLADRVLAKKYQAARLAERDQSGTTS